MNIKQKVSMGTVKVARHFFWNTPFQRWPITSWVYAKVFHFGYSEKDITVDYFGIYLNIPSKDITIVPGIVGGFYEKTELELFRELCSISETVVDVGGNIGLYSCIGAKAFTSNKGVLYTFEPVKENIAYLRNNVVKNKLQEQVTIIPKALGDKEEMAKIYLAKDNIGTHSMSKAATKSEEFEEVEVTTIDSYFKKIKIDILKIDVEGFDGFVLNGAMNSIKKYHPALFIELVPRHLINNNFNPTKFTRLIYENYDYIFLVDEINNSIAQVSNAQLKEFVAKGGSANIVAVQSLKQAELINNLANKKSL